MSDIRKVAQTMRRRQQNAQFALQVIGWVVAIVGFGALGILLRLKTPGAAAKSAAGIAASVTRTIHSVLPPVSNAVSEGAPNLLVQGTMAVPVIMYHDVLPSKQVWFDLTTSEFAAEMADLAQAHAHPVTIQQYYDHFAQGKPLPSRPILLTFDDCTLGQYTQALPILEQYHFPAVFFVQTASVGVTTVKQHMDWEQLRQAEATGLITVESHTVTHPEDMTILTPDRLDAEMQQSKAALEAHLHHPIQFLAYPSGTCDAAVAHAAKEAGYLAAFTMDRGWTVSPAQSYFLPRFTPKRVEEVIAVWEGRMEMAPPPARMIAVNPAPVTMGVYTGGRFPVEWLAGGSLATETLDHRDTVGNMAQQAGAQAALNGTFFADARVQSNSGAMIGPCLSRVNHYYAKVDPGDNARIEGRPLILFGDKECIVFPYTAHLGGSERVLQQMMPDVQDAFVAGGWIVHYGKAVSREQMALWSSSDFKDPRHRSFVGIDAQGRYMLGATQDSISCGELARLLVQMHVQEAWLLDSGFSTSLIWQNRVLVSGHSQPGIPSRPVPHALFLLGSTAANAPPPPADAVPAAGTGAATLQQALSADSTAGAATYYSRYHIRRRTMHRRHRSQNVPSVYPPAANP